MLILFTTQLGIFEAMVRVTTDAAHATSPRPWHYVILLLNFLFFGFFFLNFIADFIGDPLVTFCPAHSQSRPPPGRAAIPSRGR